MSVSPPAFVMSPSETPVADLSGSCLSVIISVPDETAPATTVLAKPIGFPFPSATA